MANARTQRRVRPPRVRDITRPVVTSAEPNDHVAAAAYLMKQASSTALVTQANGTAQPE
jgi:hypothetical protein